MTTTVRIQESISPLIAEWESLAQRKKAIPFLWPGWIAAWWSTFGAGRLQILTVYEDDHLTGVLPLCRLHGKLGSPTNSETPLFGFLAEDETAVKRLSHALFSQRTRSIGLSFLSPADDGVSLTRAAAAAAHYQVLTESIQAAPYVATDGPWDVYQSRLRRKFRSELRRRRRRHEHRLAPGDAPLLHRSSPMGGRARLAKAGLPAAGRTGACFRLLPRTRKDPLPAQDGLRLFLREVRTGHDHPAT